MKKKKKEKEFLSNLIPLNFSLAYEQCVFQQPKRLAYDQCVFQQPNDYHFTSVLHITRISLVTDLTPKKKKKTKKVYSIK